MYYVYLLQSESFADQRYVGMASDLSRRIAGHNAGKSPHTSKYLPWRLVTYIAYRQR
jgi:putative endonuclease